MYKWFLIVACVLAALFGLIIGVMNPEPVVLNLPAYSLELPLGPMLMLGFVAGFLLGLLVFLLLFYLPSRWTRTKPTSGSSAMSKLDD